MVYMYNGTLIYASTMFRMVTKRKRQLVIPLSLFKIKKKKSMKLDNLETDNDIKKYPS